MGGAFSLKPAPYKSAEREDLGGLFFVVSGVGPLQKPYKQISGIINSFDEVVANSVSDRMCSQ